MTNRLYETDGMLRECSAVITGYEEINGCHYITLDQTVFAPEGGGQKADRGFLYPVADGKVSPPDEQNRITLLDGQDKIKGCTLEGPIYRISEKFTPGTSVLCKLDWGLRFMRMQQHSSEHILSGLVHQHFGYNNISFHLSDTEPVIVCFDGILNEDDIAKIEAMANQAIYVNLPIQVSFPDKTELSRIEYRSKIEIQGQVRLVTIPGVDICACCAPHLMSTGQIGLIKIVSMQSYKGGTQLNILCGQRALALLKNEHDILAGLARVYSTSVEQLTDAILTQREEGKKAKEELASLTEAQLLKTIDEMPDTAIPCLFAPSLSPHAMKICYNALTQKYESYCGVFNGDDETGYQFYAGHPALDSMQLAVRIREDLNGKGGGSKEMIQGKLAKKEEEIRLFFQNLS
ncbi:MAG: alanyl-tRNA editing protein [Lachnospiraceae bacterium]|nr:alanyl-tRNA editing protein [Lachnospiraceae bacterium]